MHSRVARIFGAAVLFGIFGTQGCGSNPLSSAASLYEQLGGTESMSKLAGSLLSTTSKDSRLSALMGAVDQSSAAPKVANQLCATLGGGCSAPFTDSQVAEAAAQLTPDQKSAVSEGLTSSLKSLGSNAAVQEAATKALGPNVGGILALL